MRTALEHAVNVHKALGHATRLRILAMLRGGELCVCQLNAVLGVAPSTLSAHLAELKDAGLVAERKSSRWVYYRLTGGEAAEVLQALWTALADDPQLELDAQLLARVAEYPVEALRQPGFDVAGLRRACCADTSKESCE